MNTVTKTSISIRPQLRAKLKHAKNRSVIINKALQLYYDREKIMMDAEDRWLYESIAEARRDITNGDVVSMNPNGEKLTKDEIAAFLQEQMRNL